MSLFIAPSKKKKRSESLSDDDDDDDGKEETRRPVKYKCARSEPVTTESTDVDFGYTVKGGPSMSEKRDQMLVTSLMAVNLYLTPRIVTYNVVYWITQYANYTKPENLWFNDHITKLIQYPVNFSINTTHGLPRLHARVARHTLLLHFAGHELHKMPGDYFDVKGNTDLFECLDYFINRTPHHFLVRNTFGVKGEVELDSFVYNRLLNYFYEPSFLIITSYQIYLHYLFHLSGGRTLNDFLPSITLIAKPLDEKCLHATLTLSLDKRNSNYVTKQKTFLADMRAIREILALNDVKHIEDQIELLWSRKASEVSELAHVRYEEIYSQLEACCKSQ